MRCEENPGRNLVSVQSTGKVRWTRNRDRRFKHFECVYFFWWEQKITFAKRDRRGEQSLQPSLWSPFSARRRPTSKSIPKKSVTFANANINRPQFILMKSKAIKWNNNKRCTDDRRLNQIIWTTWNVAIFNVLVHNENMPISTKHRNIHELFRWLGNAGIRSQVSWKKKASEWTWNGARCANIMPPIDIEPRSCSSGVT